MKRRRRGRFAGLDRFEARTAVVACDERRLLVKVEPHATGAVFRIAAVPWSVLSTIGSAS